MRWLPFLSILTILIFISSGITGSYKESAHGNSTYGVKRDVTELSDYARGNCAHCHEMHASVEGSEPEPSPSIGAFAVFSTNFDNSSKVRPTTGYSETHDFCFYCHGPNSLQVGGITNYDYSQTFGGAPENENATTIMDAFNQASYHNLYDIWDFANDTFSFFTSDSNPCVACHNPHIAKKSCGKPGGSFDPTQSAISKPSDHGNLWGDDDDTERMDDYTTNYQPPYCWNSTNLEPDCSSSNRVTQASKTPDYVTFCTDCHNSNNLIYSNTLNRNLYKIDWETAGGESGGDKHGKNSATNGTNIRDPFASSTLGNFVLSCLDCHEPHGSPNVMLVRREVNGDLLGGSNTIHISTYDSSDWKYLCSRCHKDDSNFTGGGTGEAYKWQYIHHCDDDAPYLGSGECGKCHGGGDGGGGGGDRCTGGSRPPINCTYCHYHGGDDSWVPIEKTGRHTF